MGRMLTATEAAKISGLSEKTIRLWLKSGKLAVKPKSGKAWQIDIDDLAIAIGRPLEEVEKPVVAELIQHDMTPARLASETARLLDNPAERATMREELVRVAARLSGPGDAIARAADEVDRVMMSTKPVLEVSQ